METDPYRHKSLGYGEWSSGPECDSLDGILDQVDDLCDEVAVLVLMVEDARDGGRHSFCDGLQHAVSDLPGGRFEGQESSENASGRSADKAAATRECHVAEAFCAAGRRTGFKQARPKLRHSGAIRSRSQGRLENSHLPVAVAPEPGQARDDILRLERTQQLQQNLAGLLPDLLTSICQALCLHTGQAMGTGLARFLWSCCHSGQQVTQVVAAGYSDAGPGLLPFSPQVGRCCWRMA